MASAVRHLRASVRASACVAAVLALTGCTVTLDQTSQTQASQTKASQKSAGSSGSDVPAATVTGASGSALKQLTTIKIKGRAPATGYSRAQFGPAWADTDHNGCDQRDDVLRRDLTGETFRAGTHGCVVITGTLHDPYTGTTIHFTKAAATKVQIDHVVALENAWVTGASAWTKAKREQLATDPLNLLAVDGSTNESKGSGDAATWLPPQKSFRCAYVARQVAVKSKYGAWMTAAEEKAAQRILSTCPAQKLPRVAPWIPLGQAG
jgi:hypothetical protein